MPSQHNHADRGKLHIHCPACEVVAKTMSDAGIDPNQVTDLRREPAAVHVHSLTVQSADPAGFAAAVNSPGSVPTINFMGIPMHQVHATDSGVVYESDRPLTDSEIDKMLDIAGIEMGNKASVEQDWADERPSGFGWGDLAELAVAGTVGQAWLAQAQHLLGEHADYVFTATKVRETTLDQLHALHGSLHTLEVGHLDSRDHMVRPYDHNTVLSHARLGRQKQFSRLNKVVKAAEHTRRTEVAREQRRQAQIDATRALTRAVHHAAGTVMPRLNMLAGAAVSLQVGSAAPLTLAKVSWGGVDAVGAANCRPGDTYDYVTGSRLAVGRALMALGRLVEESGYELDAYRSKDKTR